MADISSPGIGSGIDVNSIVSQLVQIESQPLFALQTRQTELQAQLSAYGLLKSALSGFESAMSDLADVSKFQVFSADSSDDAVLTATAGSTAVPGTYNLSVTRIAETHRMASTTTFADTDTTLIGTAGDSMTITVGASAFTVDIGAKTLADIRDAINDATDNTGVSATIITDDVGSRLLLASDETGSADALTVSYSGADPFTLSTLNADRNGDLSFTPADLDAVFTLEGQYTVTRSSNSVSDVIDGVTLQLEQAGSAVLTVSRDTAKVTSAVQEFVSKYNELIKTIDGLRGNELKSDTTSLLSIESAIRNVLRTKPEGLSGQFDLLFEVGIETEINGTLSLDSTVLGNALAKDFSGVAELFGNTGQGFAYRLAALADGFLETNGVIDARTNGISQRINGLEDRQEVLQFRLKTIEARLFAQFNAMDALVAQLQATSNFLTQQLSVLPGTTGQSSSG